MKLRQIASHALGAIILGLACARREAPKSESLSVAQVGHDTLQSSPLADTTRARVLASVVKELASHLLQATEASVAPTRQTAETPPLKLATLHTNYSGRPDEYDGEHAGSRITQADGLDHIEAQYQAVKASFRRACESAAASLPAVVNELPEAAQPTPVEICNVYGNLVGQAPGRRIDDFFARRRQSEIQKVFGYLAGRVGSLSGRLGADKERAIMYLGHLAARVTPEDGALGLRVIDLADRAGKWRDRQIDTGQITADMREELEARAFLGSLESSFRRNEAISAEIVREKAARSPAQREAAYQAVCDAVVEAGLATAADARKQGCTQ